MGADMFQGQQDGQCGERARGVGGGEGAVMSGRQWAQPQWAHRHFVQEEGLVYSVWLN